MTSEARRTGIRLGPLVLGVGVVLRFPGFPRELTGFKAPNGHPGLSDRD